MSNEIKTLIVCELTSLSVNVQSTTDRLAQCMDLKGGGEQAYFELGRLEATGAHINKICRILARMNLEKDS